MATVERALRIEPGSSEDLDAVMRIMDSAFGDHFGEAWTRSQLAGILPMQGVALTVARDPESDSAIGFSLCRTVADEAELLLIAVLPEHHRRQVGRNLLEDFVLRARNHGVTRAHLEVRDGNSALDLYLKAGFAPVGRRRNYYRGSNGRCFDAVTLSYQP